MKIILHAYKNSESRICLKRLIEELMPEVQIEFTDSQQQLYEKLCRPLNNYSALIAFLDDSEGAELLLSLKDLFENIKLILVFAKEINGSRKSLILLEPVCTMFSENSFMDIISVLKRIQQKQKPPLNLFDANRSCFQEIQINPA